MNGLWHELKWNLTCMFAFFTVDSIRWVRPDCIMLGCYCLSADGNEENHAVQLISVKDGKITNVSKHFSVFLVLKRI